MVRILYRILAELLASRLKKVLSNLIFNCQTDFLPKRQILDGVLIINELVDHVKRHKRSFMLFKVDFEKAYDCVSSDFLRFMMRRLSFGAKWLGWMEGLVFNSLMFILINGSPTKDFKVS